MARSALCRQNRATTNFDYLRDSGTTIWMSHWFWIDTEDYTIQENGKTTTTKKNDNNSNHIKCQNEARIDYLVTVGASNIVIAHCNFEKKKRVQSFCAFAIVIWRKMHHQWINIGYRLLWYRSVHERKRERKRDRKCKENVRRTSVISICEWTD